MVLFSIGEVAERMGLAASAIRYYEKLGLIEEPVRSGGRRCYDESVLRRLAVILSARDVGLSLEEIHSLLNEFPEGTAPATRWQVVAPRKLRELEDLTGKIEAMKVSLFKTLQCGCATLEECVSGWDTGRGRLTCR